MLPPLIIDKDMGGYIHIYEQQAQELIFSGRKVIIRGICASACTLMVSRAQNNVCIMPSAQLWFHSAWVWNYQPHPPGNQQLWNSYSPRLRAWITARGGLPDPRNWLKLAGAQLRQFFPLCRK